MTRAALVAVVLATGCHAGKPAARPAAPATPSLSLVVDPTGAEVIETRRVQIAAGESWLAWDGAPRGLDAAGASLTVVDGAPLDVRQAEAAPAVPAQPPPGARVIVRAKRGEFRGTLLAISPGAVALQEDGLEGPTLVMTSEVRAIETPGGGAPALRFRVHALAAGARTVQVHYRTTGLAWHAVVSMVFDPDEHAADVQAEVHLENRAGASYRGATVVLAASAAAAAAKPGSAAIFPLPGTIDVPDGSAVAVPLADARAVPVKRVLIFDAVGEDGVWKQPTIQKDRTYPTDTRTSVEAYLEVENKKDVGLGLSLPPGEVRFYQRGQDGATRFLGARAVDGVQAGERVRISLGIDPDVIGARRQVEVDVDDDLRRIVEEIEVTVENHGAAPRDVTVVERLARSDWWRLTWWSADAEKDGSRSVRFQVHVPAKDKQTIRYRVIYRW